MLAAIEREVVMMSWGGTGAVLFAIVFLSSLAANLITDAIFGTGYYTAHQWPLAISLAVSASIIWLMGRHLEQKAGRVLIDKETGQEVVLKNAYTFLFVPMTKWALILLAVAVVLAIAEFLP